MCVGLLDVVCITKVSAQLDERNDGHCVDCAHIWNERVRAWRFGVPDPICEIVLSPISGH